MACIKDAKVSSLELEFYRRIPIDSNIFICGSGKSFT